MPQNLRQVTSSTSATSSPIASFPASLDGQDQTLAAGNCHGVLYDAIMVAPSVVFVVYLGLRAKKNLRKLRNGRSYIMISYYALLWLATVLSLAWSCLQAWKCSHGNGVSWNFLTLFTTSAMLFLEISLVAFLLQEDYATALQSLARIFTVSGIVVSIDALLKVIYVFGFGVPLFIDDNSNMHRSKWALWFLHTILLAAIYGYILFVHYSKWKEKLPPRPAFYNYIIVMFVATSVTSFACGLAVFGSGIGIWLYNVANISYHSLYLPLCYFTFLSDFFQEQDFLLDNACYSEMRDAGFFDTDWD